MNGFILALQLLPLLGLLLILFFGRSEARIANISFWVTHGMGACMVGLLAIWAYEGFPRHEFLWFTLYRQGDFAFPLLFYFDHIGAVYLFCTWIIFSVIVRYCRYYLHREPGYKRFFMTIFGFVFGLNMVILSGVLDMFFAGWEIVGIASFLLIAFYRHRPQPIRNALKTYSIYRICDVGLLLGAWLADLLLHEGSHFSHLAQTFSEGSVPPGAYAGIFMLSLLLMTAACGKSAQFPFCYWLPRAMEGPTPSSAIFYGALSVHLGVFLLLRTQPIWEFAFISRLAVFAVGLLTVGVATVAEKAQSNIKGQIAYASIAQVGLMFVELALGLETLVLIHFLGNAFLRCYQLLVSPSIVAHLLRVEGAADVGFDISSRSIVQFFPVLIRNPLAEVLQATLLVLALQEFNLEAIVRSLLWEPLGRVGNAVNNAMALGWVWLGGLGLTAVILLGLEYGIVEPKHLVIPIALGMVVTAFSAFARKAHVLAVWNTVALSALLAGLAVWFANEVAVDDVTVFFAGVGPAWLTGLLVLGFLCQGEQVAVQPFAFLSLVERKPRLSLLFFLCFLGMVSFPIGPSFLGEELLIHHMGRQHPWLVALIATSFVLNGIALASAFLRLYSRFAVDVSPGNIWPTLEPEPQGVSRVIP